MERAHWKKQNVVKEREREHLRKEKVRDSKR
jgi:hypothetical protein